MLGGVRIGRVFGIEITIDYSWGLVFLLMSWNLTRLFETWHPTWTLAGALFLAVVAALAFFASLLAHELAHAVVARSFGMKVREIRLFLLGGVSNIETEPPTPQAELWMAVAGPLTSFALGLLALALASSAVAGVDARAPVETLGRLAPAETLLFWLGPINLVLGVFNLLPAFPLDGGRVLRAVLWRTTGDFHRATAWATGLGRVVGGALVLGGVAMVLGARLPLLGRGAGSGLWLLFIGWYLASSARQTFGSLLVQEALEGVRVGDLMAPPNAVVPADTTIRALVDDWLTRSSEHGFPVVEGDAVVGLVSLADLRKRPRDVWDLAPVADIMTPRRLLADLTPTDDARHALAKLSDLDLDRLPVYDRSGHLAGVLSRTAVARWLELHARRRPPVPAPRHA
jgi:Zn-dependent protease/CBS domain-containing protein